MHLVLRHHGVRGIADTYKKAAATRPPFCVTERSYFFFFAAGFLAAGFFAAAFFVAIFVMHNY